MSAVLTVAATAHAAPSGAGDAPPPAPPRDAEPDPDRLDAAIDSAGIGAIAAVGIVGASLAGNDHRAGLELAGGALAALLPVGVMVDTQFDALHRDYNSSWRGSVGSVLARGIYGLSVASTITLGALGTYASGVALDPPASRGDALRGSFAGATLGTLAAILTTEVLAKVAPSHERLRVGVAASLVGTGASLGYQLERGR
jgi:hypothetical protein